MPDEEGYLAPGDLPLGSYAAGEFDLGESLRPLAGFGRDLEELYEDEVPCAGGFGTAPGLVRYVSPDQLETWAAVRGWRS